MKHDKVMNVAKKRGFLWSSFEIYAGVAGFYDYGPLGAILKNAIIEKVEKILYCKGRFLRNRITYNNA